MWRHQFDSTDMVGRLSDAGCPTKGLKPAKNCVFFNNNFFCLIPWKAVKGSWVAQDCRQIVTYKQIFSSRLVVTSVDKSSGVDKNSGIDNITDSLYKCGIKAGA